MQGMAMGMLEPSSVEQNGAHVVFQTDEFGRPNARFDRTQIAAETHKV